MVVKKLVRLINTEIIVHGCVEALDINIFIRQGTAIIKIHVLPENKPPITINNKPIKSINDIPDIISNTTIEINNGYADIIIYDDKEKEMCIAYIDENQAQLPCVKLSDLKQLIPKDDLL